MKTREIISLLAVLLLAVGCSGGYSFTGASIPPGAKTLSVATFPNNASTVNPQLSQKLTDELMQMFSSQTPLSVMNGGEGDLHVEGEITGYDTRASSLSSNDEVSMNRLTVTVRYASATPSIPRPTSSSRSLATATIPPHAISRR